MLRQDHLALLKRTLHADVLDLIAEINGLLDQGDETPFDFQRNGSTLLDLLLQGAASLNGEGLATMKHTESIRHLHLREREGGEVKRTVEGG